MKRFCSRLTCSESMTRASESGSSSADSCYSGAIALSAANRKCYALGSDPWLREMKAKAPVQLAVCLRMRAGVAAQSEGPAQPVPQTSQCQAASLEGEGGMDAALRAAVTLAAT